MKDTKRWVRLEDLDQIKVGRWLMDKNGNKRKILQVSDLRVRLSHKNSGVNPTKKAKRRYKLMGKQRLASGAIQLKSDLINRDYILIDLH